MRRFCSELCVALLLFFAGGVCALAQGQTDVALSVYGAFTNSTTPGNSNFSRMIPANAAGGLLEVRHISNPLLGWEGSYSFRRADELYDEMVETAVPACPGPGCSNYTDAVSANAQELTAGWVPSVKTANFRLFGLLGVGLLLNQPVGGQSGTTNTTQAAIVYGAGLDWGFGRHIGLRMQYRGNVYKAPGIVPPNNTNPNVGYMHTAEPAIGLYYRF
ncbi:MAG: outer membrane beta-barrel protein [Acidobacteriaceae bacterium]